jgi:hypothetical protein
MNTVWSFWTNQKHVALKKDLAIQVTIASTTSTRYPGRHQQQAFFKQSNNLSITMKYSAPIACALLASSAAAFAPATSQVGFYSLLRSL